MLKSRKPDTTDILRRMARIAPKGGGYYIKSANVDDFDLVWEFGGHHVTRRIDGRNLTAARLDKAIEEAKRLIYTVSHF